MFTHILNGKSAVQIVAELAKRASDNSARGKPAPLEDFSTVDQAPAGELVASTSRHQPAGDRRERTYDDNAVIRPDLDVLRALVSYCAEHGKTHCWPSQATLLRRYKRLTGRTICRRTLNRHLAALQRDLYIDRRRRHRMNRKGELELHSTLYTFLARATSWLVAGAEAAAALVAAVMKQTRTPAVKRWAGRLASSFSLFAVPAAAQSLRSVHQTEVKTVAFGP